MSVYAVTASAVEKYRYSFFLSSSPRKRGNQNSGVCVDSRFRGNDGKTFSYTIIAILMVKLCSQDRKTSYTERILVGRCTV